MVMQSTLTLPPNPVVLKRAGHIPLQSKQLRVAGLLIRGPFYLRMGKDPLNMFLRTHFSALFGLAIGVSLAEVLLARLSGDGGWLRACLLLSCPHRQKTRTDAQQNDRPNRPCLNHPTNSTVHAPSRGKALRPRDFSHRLRDEKRFAPSQTTERIRWPVLGRRVSAMPSLTSYSTPAVKFSLSCDRARSLTVS